ncbi:unnamed protein product [Macrosiphum euphorbiae]|uniref:Uncharacterized protein n=1 Tax=Macrosiphum euphorbiae TaxID=13131 RepID=A0AAV0WBI1_9HEMI|nr:unnamed protein product [Macrosiphum euphorbiae]
METDSHSMSQVQQYAQAPRPTQTQHSPARQPSSWAESFSALNVLRDEYTAGGGVKSSSPTGSSQVGSSNMNSDVSGNSPSLTVLTSFISPNKSNHWRFSTINRLYSCRTTKPAITKSQYVLRTKGRQYIT